MIRVDSLSVSFGSFRIRDVSFHVPAGEALLVLGPSGAGKSLLLETILGIKRPEAGRVFIDGVDVTFRSPEERKVSYLPQDVALFPHLSVRENILFGVQARGRRADDSEYLAQLLELLDIGGLWDRPDIRTLSGGERQRVAMARALMVRPRVLFLDECFSSLDAPIRAQLQEQLRKLKRSLGLTIFQVTHDQEEAFLLGDRVAVLMDGRLEQIGQPREVYSRPASLKVARFLLMRNLFEARLLRATGDELVCDVGGLQLAVHAPQFSGQALTHVGFSPAEVELAAPNGVSPYAAGKNVFTGQVVELAHLGHRKTVRVRLLGAPEVVIEGAVLSWAARTTPLQVGDSVEVRIAPEAIVCFAENS